MIILGLSTAVKGQVPQGRVYIIIIENMDLVSYIVTPL